MKQFNALKKVTAKPMTRQEYNDLRGWKLASDDAEGYLTVDAEIEANISGYDGEVSWTPKEHFDKHYYRADDQPVDRMAIENLQLLERLKALDSLLEKPQPKFISDKQWSLLQSQRAYMKGYFKVLNERIEDMAAQKGI